jgi:apolipoprotein N-acyltransferase
MYGIHTRLRHRLQPVLSGNRGSWWIGLAAAIALWFSFPPIGWSWLGWLATVPWAGLVIRQRLPGKRPYWQLWWVGWCYWLATFYFIPLPHPALWLGWLVLACYLAIYTPLLIGIARLMTGHWKLPVWIAFPVVYTGLEWIRCHFATGMAMVCLSHSQYRHPLLIQVADIGGAYTVTFLMTMFAAGLADACWGRQASTRWLSAAVPVASLGMAILYGTFVLPSEDRKPLKPIRVAIVQGSLDVVFVPISEDQRQENLDHYVQLTRQATEQWKELDLLLWPESSFTLPDLVSDYSAEFTREIAAEELTLFYRYLFAAGQSSELDSNRPRRPGLLAGATTYDPAREKFYNSAILLESDGKVSSRYLKNHRVLLGEYVPLADRFPMIATLTPIGRNLTKGEGFTAMHVNQIILAPSICFETTVPHLIRQQVNSLARQGAEPDALVNLTNDGWFFGTSCLDLHLACNVFRAVEMKKPHLVCANTGFSAEIDPYGRLLQVGPRREPAVLKVELGGTDIPATFYRGWGNWLPAITGYLTLFAALQGCWFWWTSRN